MNIAILYKPVTEKSDTVALMITLRTKVGSLRLKCPKVSVKLLFLTKLWSFYGKRGS